MDKKYEALTSVTSTTDVMGYQGDCTSINSQKEAGIKDADLLIAVTDNDEINMLTCLIARKTGRGKCHTIARIRSPQYTDEIGYLKEELGLSMSINPEMVAADEMVRHMLGNDQQLIIFYEYEKGKFEMPDESEGFVSVRTVSPEAQ